jgi:hypothetical protein
VIAVLCALTQPAHAYVDPGSGLVAIQIVSSTFAGIIFLLRSRLRQFIRKIPHRLKAKREDDAQD